MKIVKDAKPNTFKVESSSKPGKFYNVDMNKPFCTCPAFRFRMGSGGLCKHIHAIQEQLSNKNSGKSDKILEIIKKKGEVDSIILIEKFGEDIVNELIKEGQIIETKGKIKILE